MVQTYNDIYLSLRRTLREAGIEAYALEARLLLAAAAGFTPSELLARLRMYAGPEVAGKAEALAARRVRGEPAAYITGMWEFYGLPLFVTPAVLIPRTDTEVLVGTALDALRGRRMDARIMDLCCGSGCVGCAIASRLPAARAILVDVSPDALAVCRKNIALNHLAARCVCMEADVLGPPPMRLGNFDLIACNPPYIPTGELQDLDPSVREWEPRLALDGGSDGLEFYLSLLAGWKSVLSDGGFFMFEVGEGQAEPVKELMGDAGLTGIGGALDTIGVERVVYGKK